MASNNVVINIDGKDNLTPILNQIKANIVNLKQNARISLGAAGGSRGGGGFGSLLGPIAGVYSAARAISFLTDSIVNLGKGALEQARTLDQVNKRLQFSYGGRYGAMGAQAKEMKFAESIGLEKVGTVEAFSKFSAAASESGLTTDQSRKVFENTSKAIAAFGLKSEEAKGIFLALSQMLNKGVVSSEELRRQMGERLPGAMAMAAKAMNMTMPEFMKQLTTGKIKSKEFVLALSELFGKKFSDQADRNIYSLEGQINNLTNSFTDLKSAIGDSFGATTLQLMEAFANKVKGLSTLIKIFAGESRESSILSQSEKFAKSEEGKKLAEMILKGDTKGIERGLKEKQEMSDKAILEFSKKVGSVGMEKIIGKKLTDEIIAERNFFKIAVGADKEESRKRLISKSEQASKLIQQAPQPSPVMTALKQVPLVGKEPIMMVNAMTEFVSGASRNAEVIENYNKSLVIGNKQFKGVNEAVEETGIELDAYKTALSDVTKKTNEDLTGAGKEDRLKTDYHTPKIININILTGEGASMIAPGGVVTNIETLEADSQDITNRVKTVLEEQMNMIIQDTSSSMLRAAQSSAP
jgi:tape measure domain-containing protein